jgi:hypothetical protein
MTGTGVRGGVFPTLLSLAVAGAGSTVAMVLGGEEQGAGLALVGTAALLMLAGRVAGDSPRLLLFHSVAERALDAAPLGAIAWAALPEEPRLAAVGVAALGVTYLAAYFRVRSQGLSFDAPVALLSRPIPLLLLATGLLVGELYVAMWGVAVFGTLVLLWEIQGLGRTRVRR